MLIKILFHSNIRCIIKLIDNRNRASELIHLWLVLLCCKFMTLIKSKFLEPKKNNHELILDGCPIIFIHQDKISPEIIILSTQLIKFLH